MQALQWEVGNLTNAVMELQKLAVEHYGVTVQHPITLGEKEEGDEDAAEGDETQQDGTGEEEGGSPPAVNLRGAEGNGENPDGGEEGDGDVGADDTADAGGEGARRLLERAKGDQEEKTGRGGEA